MSGRLTHNRRVADFLHGTARDPIHTPGEYTVLRREQARTLAARVEATAGELGLQVPLARWHEQEPPRAAGLWARALHRALCREIDLLHAVVRALPWQRSLPAGSSLQHPPRLRFRPPGSSGAEFHTDAWANNPADQLIIWIPLVATEGEESLWLLPSEETRGLYELPFAQAQSQMRRVAAPLPLTVGEVLLMDGSTGHGAPRHSAARTRVSVDIRLSLAAPGPRAWPAVDAGRLWLG